MKFSKLIVLAATLMSFSSFAQDRGDGPGNNSVNRECVDLSLGFRVCGEVLEDNNQNLIIRNFDKKIQPRKSLEKEICESIGDAFNEYKTTADYTRSWSFVGTKGSFTGLEVSISSGPWAQKVYSKITCSKK